MRRLAALALLAAMALPAVAEARQAPEAVQPCVMQPADEAWLKGALAAWVRTAKHTLRIDAGKRPTFLVFDGRCAWRADPSPGFTWRGHVHGGKVPAPGGDLPVAPTAFATPSKTGAALVIALPSVWRAAGVTSELGLETLITSVFVHETTHTRQFYAFTPRMDALTARWKLPDDLDDNSLQRRFEGDADYVTTWKGERDLLYGAAAAASDNTARALARAALTTIRARQVLWFADADAQWADLDDTFLTLEGLGNFAAYSWLIDPEGGGLEPKFALEKFRRGGRWWSQDEGLAIFLVVDRLVPDWRKRAFAAKPATALELLALAAGE